MFSGSNQSCPKLIYMLTLSLLATVPSFVKHLQNCSCGWSACACLSLPEVPVLCQDGVKTVIVCHTLSEEFDLVTGETPQRKYNRQSQNQYHLGKPQELPGGQEWADHNKYHYKCAVGLPDTVFQEAALTATPRWRAPWKALYPKHGPKCHLQCCRPLVIAVLSTSRHCCAHTTGLSGQFKMWQCPRYNTELQQQSGVLG